MRQITILWALLGILAIRCHGLDQENTHRDAIAEIGREIAQVNQKIEAIHAVARARDPEASYPKFTEAELIELRTLEAHLNILWNSLDWYLQLLSDQNSGGPIRVVSIDGDTRSDRIIERIRLQEQWLALIVQKLEYYRDRLEKDPSDEAARVFLELVEDSLETAQQDLNALYEELFALMDPEVVDSGEEMMLVGDTLFPVDPTPEEPADHLSVLDTESAELEVPSERVGLVAVILGASDIVSE